MLLYTEHLSEHLVLSSLCGFCLLQDVQKGRDRKSKFLLIENTKLCIRPIKEIIIDEYSHRERDSNYDVIVMVHGFSLPVQFCNPHVIFV
jgi:hypothetical protein